MLEREEEVVAEVAWARQAGAKGAAGKEAAERARRSSPSPPPDWLQIVSAADRLRRRSSGMSPMILLVYYGEAQLGLITY